MKKKIKDLTRRDIEVICSKHKKTCSSCPIYKKEYRACPRVYFDTLHSKFSDLELDKEVEVDE